MKELALGRQKLGIGVAGLVREEGFIADGEVAPGGLQFGIATADHEADLIVVDTQQVLPVLDPAVVRHRRGVGGKADEPWPLAQGGRLVLLLVAEDEHIGGLGGGRRRDGPFPPELQEGGDGVGGQVLDAQGRPLVLQVSPARGGEGEARIAATDRRAVRVALVDGLDAAAVWIGEPAVELGRPLERGKDLLVAAGRIVNPQGLKVDLVVDYDRPAALGPVAALGLRGGDLAQMLGRVGAPLRAIEGRARQIEAHRVVRGDVVHVAELAAVNARVAERQGTLPSLARVGGHVRLDDLEAADPSRVDPGHPDVAPCAAILLGEDPLALLIGVGDQVVAGLDDDFEQTGILVVTVARPIQGVRDRQNVHRVLVGAHPNAFAEVASLGVEGLEDLRHMLDQSGREAVLVHELLAAGGRNHQ